MNFFIFIAFHVTVSCGIAFFSQTNTTSPKPNQFFNAKHQKLVVSKNTISINDHLYDIENTVVSNQTTLLRTAAFTAYVQANNCLVTFNNKVVSVYYANN